MGSRHWDRRAKEAIPIIEMARSATTMKEVGEKLGYPTSSIQKCLSQLAPDVYARFVRKRATRVKLGFPVRGRANHTPKPRIVHAREAPLSAEDVVNAIETRLQSYSDRILELEAEIEDKNNRIAELNVTLSHYQAAAKKQGGVGGLMRTLNLR